MRKKDRCRETEFLNKLESQISHLYDKIERTKKYKEGEIDLIGYSNEKKDIYEVKAGNNHKNIKKAKEQLDKAKKFFSNVENTFIYIGKEDLIMPYKP